MWDSAKRHLRTAACVRLLWDRATDIGQEIFWSLTRITDLQRPTKRSGEMVIGLGLAVSFFATLPIRAQGVIFTPLSGDGQSAVVGQPFSGPLVVQVTQAGKPKSGVYLTFMAPPDGANPSATFTVPPASMTDSNGVATAIPTANAMLGEYTVTVVQIAGAGAAAPALPLPAGTPFATFKLKNVAPQQATVKIRNGNCQFATLGVAFAELAVVVTDQSGKPANNALITFTALPNKGGASAALSSPTVTTDSTGKAAVTATANTIPGAFSVDATAMGASTTFTLTNVTAPQPGAISMEPIADSSCQNTIAGKPFPVQLVVSITDSKGAPVSGTTVNFAVTSKGGATAALSQASAKTDSQGKAAVTATANATAGGPYTVTATAPDLKPQPPEVVFTLTNLTAPDGSIATQSSVCDPVMSAIITGATFVVGDFIALAKCTQLLYDDVRTLSDTKTKTTSGEISNPKTSDTTAIFATQSKLDAHYFGWNQGDIYDDTLQKIKGNLGVLMDRVYSNKKGWYFVPFSSRLRREWGYANPGNSMFHDYADPVKKNLAVADADLTSAMEDEGLTEPFSALLETYLIPYSSAGTNAVPSALNGLNTPTQSFAAGFLSFESSHFRAQNGVGEMSIGGRIGVSPTETLVSLSSAPTAPKAYLQNSFNWSLNARGTARMGSSLLFAGLFTFGQNIILTNSSVVTPTTSSTTSGTTGTSTPAVTTSAFGNTQSAAWFYELGPEIRIYPYRLQRVASEKKYLLPSFSFATGLRVDDRFTDLNQQQFGNFDKPGERWFLRSFVTLTKVFERNPSQKSNSGVFNAGLGFEYDTVWGFPAGNRLVVPPNSRIYINASIDLVSAFTKQSAK